MPQVTSTLRRFKFSDIFQKNADGSLTPKKVINVNGIIFGPGVIIRPGFKFGGMDFLNFQQNDIAAEEDTEYLGVLKITGFYN